MPTLYKKPKLGDFVTIKTNPTCQEKYRIHAGQAVMVVREYPLLVECEDEHVFRVTPRDLVKEPVNAG